MPQASTVSPKYSSYSHHGELLVKTSWYDLRFIVSSIFLSIYRPISFFPRYIVISMKNDKSKRETCSLTELSPSDDLPRHLYPNSRPRVPLPIFSVFWANFSSSKRTVSSNLDAFVLSQPCLRHRGEALWRASGSYPTANIHHSNDSHFL